MPDLEFEAERRDRVARLKTDTALRQRATGFLLGATKYGYSYNFDWLGLPIIQFPQDIVAVQELIWRTKPSVIIETGVARGGSVVLSASILELLGGDGFVIGVDVDIRPANRAAIESHRLAHRIRLIEGSSTDIKVLDKVRSFTDHRQPILVFLDSLHTHAHVLEELRQYSPLVSSGSYVVVFDTIIESMPDELLATRPWTNTDNPRTAVREFLAENARFVVDEDIEARLQITVAPGGFLRCVGDPPAR